MEWREGLLVFTAQTVLPEDLNLNSSMFGGSQMCVTPAPGDPMTSSELVGNLTPSPHTHAHTRVCASVCVQKRERKHKHIHIQTILKIKYVFKNVTESDFVGLMKNSYKTNTNEDTKAKAILNVEMLKVFS